MAFIAAASINIDWAMFFAFVFIIGFIALMIWGARSTIRWACGNNDDKPQRRVRTRKPHKPIDIEIADFLRSEYPNRKPAQFI